MSLAEQETIHRACRMHFAIHRAVLEAKILENSYHDFYSADISYFLAQLNTLTVLHPRIYCHEFFHAYRYRAGSTC